MENPSSFSLVIHGGAGAIDNADEYSPSLERILREGQIMLASGASALDVVTTCVSMLEDDPMFNAGRGSVLNEDGNVEMDAAVMNGADINAGSVAGVRNIKNPIQLARLVMEQSKHVMLIGEGAMKFGALHNVATEPNEYFLTEKRIKQLKDAQEKETTGLDHSTPATEKKMGTVGAVARDQAGNLAAATSTGGITNKKFGRVGDSPIIGAGVFADNETCAVSTTGYGEQFLRTVLSKTTSTYVAQGMNAQEAADAAIGYLVRRVNGLGGLIIVDRFGNIGSSWCTAGMLHGKATAEGIWVLSNEKR
jgi:beta-aspartyl-peptidase (threonine type)